MISFRNDRVLNANELHLHPEPYHNVSDSVCQDRLLVLHSNLFFLRKRIHSDKPYAFHHKASAAMYTYTGNSTKSFDPPISVGIALQEPLSDHVTTKRAKIIMEIGDNKIHLFL